MDLSTGYTVSISGVGTFTPSSSHILYLDRYPWLTYVTRFLGIPYAEPPIGDLRFQRPQPKGNLGSYAADSDPDICPQNGADPGVQFLQISEDCLYLNIFSPSLKKPKNLPVFIWLHGGGFNHGNIKYYSGDFLANTHGRNMIVVTVQYRLGALGFLNDGTSGAGNFGLWDQQLAIQWVKNNIRSFGGNPSKITVGGQSAGAASAIYQALYPGNAGLFQRVISQSGTPLSYANWAIDRNPTQLFVAFVATVGCSFQQDVYACLRTKTVNEIVAASSALPIPYGFIPVIDGDFITDHPNTLVQQSASFHEMDLLIGDNGQDGYSYLKNTWLAAAEMQFGFDADTNGIPRTVWETSGIPFVTSLMVGGGPTSSAINDAVIDEFSTDNPFILREIAVQFATELAFTAPGVIVADVHASAAASGGSTYVYEFKHKPFYQLDPEWITQAIHSDEIPSVFGYVDELKLAVGIPPDVPFPDPPPWDRELSNMMMDMWAAFIHTG